MSANALGNLGTLYRDLDKPEKAIGYYKKAIDYALKDNSLFNLQWIYMDMSNMYLALRDTTNAYLSHVMFKKYSDAWNAAKSSQGMSDARIRYEADTRNKELQLLSLRLKNNRLLNFGFGGFIILTLVIGLLLFRGSKLKDKRRLSEMNRKISELTQANLRQQMNPHFIFNSINTLADLIEENPVQAESFTLKFSEIYRYVVTHLDDETVPVHEEIHFVKNYCELQEISSPHTIHVEIAEELERCKNKTLPLAIQIS